MASGAFASEGWNSTFSYRYHDNYDAESTRGASGSTGGRTPNTYTSGETGAATGSASTPVSASANTFASTSHMRGDNGTPYLAAGTMYAAGPGIAAFTFMVSGLEKRLHETDVNRGMFVDLDLHASDRMYVGEGYSFTVERAVWNAQDSLGAAAGGVHNATTKDAGDHPSQKFVALKHVRKKTYHGNWMNVLLEIRALLHEPLRYHPNIVRLLGLGWGRSGVQEASVFPVLVQEYAELGSFADLQNSHEQLALVTKQRLCFEIANGLSILHACSIVHGDVKHENVLIFYNQSQDKESKMPYRAKLADFGGAVMDIVDDSDGYSLRMGSPPYHAPEIFVRPDGSSTQPKITPEGLKQTDVYSFGMLVWRALLDGPKGYSLFKGTELEEKSLEVVDQAKRANEIPRIAVERITSFLASCGESDEAGVLWKYVLLNSLNANPASRELQRALAALDGTDIDTIPEVLQAAAENDRQAQNSREAHPPGTRFLSRHSLGVYRAKISGGDFDFRYHGPGSILKLDPPPSAEFHFEPLRLKSVLNWRLQQEIVADLVESAQSSATKPINPAIVIPRVSACYYLFQCYAHRFGVHWDPKELCRWLSQCAKSPDEGRHNYLAQAFSLRVHRALQVPFDISKPLLQDWLRTSILRGHYSCIQDAKSISPWLAKEDLGRTLLVTDSEVDIGDPDHSWWSVPSTENEQPPTTWQADIQNAKTFLARMCGSVGMPYYIARQLRGTYNLDDMEQLDMDIVREFSTGRAANVNEIYVNKRGDRLLHYAVALGKLTAAKHLIQVHGANIEAYNHAEHATPLVASCAAGELKCALMLLQEGANPRGDSLGQSTPLHWLFAFSDSDIPIIATKLVQAGANVNESRSPGRADVNVKWADWEELFAIPATPLLRAVLVNSIPAVKALLELGADPFALPPSFRSETLICSPLLAAAVLTYPRSLEIMLNHLDSKSAGKPPKPIFNECQMLLAAFQKRVASVDLLTSESRLVRCGRQSESALFETLELLHNRKSKTSITSSFSASVLTIAVELGRHEIVSNLLHLKHSANGVPTSRPLAAVALNDDALFRILISFEADTHIKLPQAFPPGAHFTLLQQAANRSVAAPPGLFIATYLLDNGIAVDPFPDGSPSAFALAVLNGYFDLADLLLERGADINFRYIPIGSGISDKETVSVLAELIMRQTEHSLLAIRYLLSCSAKDMLKFQVMGDGISTLHVAAGSKVRQEWIARAIAEELLDSKAHRRAILTNRHPRLGTPLQLALREHAVEVLTTLISHKETIVEQELINDATSIVDTLSQKLDRIHGHEKEEAGMDMEKLKLSRKLKRAQLCLDRLKDILMQ